MSKALLTITVLLFELSVMPSLALANSCICFACAFNPKLENLYAVSESMAPAFDTGDCAILRHINPQEEQIERGDVIGFEPEAGQLLRVFRVIAIAGDTLTIKDGQVILNSTSIPQKLVKYDEIVFPEQPPFPRCESAANPGEICTRSRFLETLPTGKSYEIFDTGTTQGDNMAETYVPKGYVFVMGDHRDNAFDSRFSKASGGPGLVSLESIKGIFDDL